MAVEPGFDAERVVEGRINLPKARYRKPAARVAMQQRVLAAMKEIQGVEAASLTSEFAVADRFRALPFVVRSGPVKTEGDRQVLVYLNAVSPGYFATMGISLHGGRDFRDDDDFQKNPVAIVDQTFAERYFPGRDVVGQEIAFGATPPAAGQPWIRIVGVVSRATLAGLEKREGWSFVYLPFNQVPSLSFSILVRSPRLGSDIVSEMRTRAQAIDPTLPLHVRGSLQSGLDAMLGNRRALVTLLGLFAALALGLAAVGLYGVLNYDVTQRTREIGIRAALGATRTQLLAMVLRQGLGKAGLGLAAGLAGAFFLARLLRGMLFDVSATDPVAYGAVAVLLLAVALGASWLPARRAAKVDPMVALRCE
jgi:predicted permease